MEHIQCTKLNRQILKNGRPIHIARQHHSICLSFSKFSINTHDTSEQLAYQDLCNAHEQFKFSPEARN